MNKQVNSWLQILLQVTGADAGNYFKRTYLKQNTRIKGLKYNSQRQTAQANSQKDDNTPPIREKHEKYILHLLMPEEECNHLKRAHLKCACFICSYFIFKPSLQ